MRKIMTTEHLAHRLGVPLQVLERIRSQKHEYYKPFDRLTNGGKKTRQVFRIGNEALHILKKINRLLMDEVDHPGYFHGGMKGKTIRSNAANHAAMPCVIKLDIKNFYPSITRDMIVAALEADAGIGPDAASMVANLGTYKDRLMTGSPCSTILSCLVIRRATDRVNGLVKQRGGRFSVYVDDITISGGAHLKQIEAECVRYIEETGVEVHKKKRIRTCGTGFSKIVTGVDVSGGIDATPKYKSEVKSLLAELSRRMATGSEISGQERLSAKGKVQHLATLNKGMARRLRTKRRDVLG